MASTEPAFSGGGGGGATGSDLNFPCSVCGNPARFMCSVCGAQAQVYYCDPACQTADWERGHKDTCVGATRRTTSGTAAGDRSRRLEHRQASQTSIAGGLREEQMPQSSSGAVSSAVSLNTTSMTSMERTSRGRTRRRRKRVQGRGNVAQVINAETHFIDRIKTFLNKFRFISKAPTPQTQSATSNSTNLDPSSAARTRNSTTDQIVIPPRGTSMEQQEPPDLVPEELTEEEKMEDLKFYLEQIYLIIKPVLCCIALSILWVKLTTPFEPNFSTGLSQQSAPSTTVGGNFGVGPSGNGEAFVGALIILAQIVVATVVVVVLFYFNCMKVLFGFFTLVVTVLLAMFGWTLGVELLSVHNLTLDKITFVFFLWNLTVVGVLMIFYKGPLFLQQAYLVIMCSKMAFTLTKLPALTTWILLALLAVWDLIAVLCPFGPLRILVEASQNNQREIPALLYTVMVWMTMATPADPPPNRLKNTGVPAPPVRAYTSSSSRSRGSLKDPPSDYGEDRQLTDSSHNWTNNTVDAAGHGGDADEVEMHIRNSEGERGSTANLVDRYQHEGEAARRRPPPLGDGTATVSDVVLEDTAARTSIDELEEEEEAARGGLKLGLGDFVFYSVLVGRAALFDWVTTVTCVVGVLTGLNMTIFLLVLYQKALPALPISIAFGILFYFVSSVTLTPFVNALVQRPNKFTVPGVDSWLWVGRGEGSGAIFV